MCGRDELKWKVTTAATEAMESARFPIEAGSRTQTSIMGIGRVTTAVQEAEDADKKLRLTALLSMTIHINATDSRDKIYSLLSLLEGEPPIKANYNISTETLYRDVTRFLIIEDSSLVILLSISTERTLATLPSWVPDLSVPSNI